MNPLGSVGRTRISAHLLRWQWPVGIGVGDDQIDVPRVHSAHGARPIGRSCLVAEWPAVDARSRLFRFVAFCP